MVETHSTWRFHGRRGISRTSSGDKCIGIELPADHQAAEVYMGMSLVEIRLFGPFASWDEAVNWLTEPEVEVDGP